MRERAAAFGGTVEAHARPDGGFRVSAVLPHDGTAGITRHTSISTSTGAGTGRDSGTGRTTGIGKDIGTGTGSGTPPGREGAGR
jgi:hypothetical protein